MSTIPHSGKTTYIHTGLVWWDFFHHLLFVKALNSCFFYICINYFMPWLCVCVCVCLHLRTYKFKCQSVDVGDWCTGAHGVIETLWFINLSTLGQAEHLSHVPLTPPYPTQIGKWKDLCLWPWEATTKSLSDRNSKQDLKHKHTQIGAPTVPLIIKPNELHTQQMSYFHSR